MPINYAQPGCGGVVGVECSAADTDVPGSIPGVNIDFSASVSQTLTLDVGLFYLSVFPVQLVKLTPILLSFFFSSSVFKLYKVNKSFFLYLCSLPIYLTVGTKH